MRQGHVIGIADLDHSQSATGNKLTACRKTGSTFVYTSLVSCGLECSSKRWVTAVDTPLWGTLTFLISVTVRRST